jgi:hypothetical protein
MSVPVRRTPDAGGRNHTDEAVACRDTMLPGEISSSIFCQ